MHLNCITTPKSSIAVRFVWVTAKILQNQKGHVLLGVKRLGSDHPDLTGSMGWLTYSLYRQGHFKEAVLLCYSIIVLVHQSVGSSHPDLVECYFHLAMIVEAMGLGDHASILREKGLSLWNHFYPIQEFNYWCPMEKGEKSMSWDWDYNGSPHGFYSLTELPCTGMWVPTEYSYGGDNFMMGPVHSF